MSRFFTLVYGVVAYALFFSTFLYLIGFVGDMVVPKSVNTGAAEGPIWLAILINAGLIGLFGVQHGIMARPGFKAWWTKIIPSQLERSTFVLATCAVLATLFVAWRSLPTTLWSIDNAAVGYGLDGLFWLGWGLVLVSTFLIDHFDLFGLRQTLSYAFGREYRQPKFTENVLYSAVRHPLMLGFLIAFWATPHMTLGRFVFAAVYTTYILLAIRVEERDLIRAHGDDYVEYRNRVPALLPVPRGRKGAVSAARAEG